MDFGRSCKVNACPDITSTWRIKFKLFLNKCLQVPKQCHAIKSRPALVLGLVKPMTNQNKFLNWILCYWPTKSWSSFFFEKEQRKQPKKQNKTTRKNGQVKAKLIYPHSSLLLWHCQEFFKGRIEIDLAKLLVHLCLSVGWGLG